MELFLLEVDIPSTLSQYNTFFFDICQLTRWFYEYLFTFSLIDEQKLEKQPIDECRSPSVILACSNIL